MIKTISPVLLFLLASAAAQAPGPKPLTEHAIAALSSLRNSYETALHRVEAAKEAADKARQIYLAALVNAQKEFGAPETCGLTDDWKWAAQDGPCVAKNVAKK
jgi:hypothetical protein